MRGRKALINSAMSAIEQLVAVICGFVLPRLIISSYGSSYNGLITSITQFLSCAVLLRAGIGGATRAALYKPIALKDKSEIDSIIKATDQFMKKVGLILLSAITVFAAIYPFMLKNEFGWLFTFTLFLIIGLSTFAESFFGVTYLILLEADQKQWISSLIKIAIYILNLVVAVILIKGGFSIHIVKLGSAFFYVLYPVLQSVYVKKKYNINKNAKPNYQAINQRWDSFFQQVSLFVMNNTDVIVLTMFTNMLEVSVYSVYHLVTNGIYRIFKTFTGSFEAAFGSMIAKDERKILQKNFSIVEYFTFSISTVVCACAGLLILQFVSIYTKDITDVNYIRPMFAYLLILIQFFAGIRLPNQLVVQAAGHYKQTKIGAMIEPAINIILSVVLVINFGLIGVAIGTLVATIFRTVQYVLYTSKNIVMRSVWISFGRCAVSLGETLIIIVIVHVLNLNMPENYFSWFVNALIIFAISIVVVWVGSICFYKDDYKSSINKIKGIIANK